MRPTVLDSRRPLFSGPGHPEPDAMPAVVRIIWPPKPTVCHPRRYAAVAAAAMKLLAEASTTVAVSKRAGGCESGSIAQVG
jgi:hypothetical protein